MDERLGKDYEDWLDSIEHTLPLPIPEEEIMGYTRTLVIQQIYSRLATLESDREEARINDKSTDDIDTEMKALRLKLQDVMNSVCPILQEGKRG
jgi:hypothetical protein